MANHTAIALYSVSFGLEVIAAGFVSYDVWQARKRAKALRVRPLQSTPVISIPGINLAASTVDADFRRITQAADLMSKRWAAVVGAAFLFVSIVVGFFANLSSAGAFGR